MEEIPCPMHTGIFFDRTNMIVTEMCSRNRKMNCGIVILSDTLKFQTYQECPDSFEDAAGSVFVKVFSTDDNEFYDWLRTTEGDVIGVRWFPYEDTSLRDTRARYLAALPNVSIDSDKLGLTIYFSASRSVDESKSGDQEFLENNVFFSSKGTFAISFAIDYLTDQERKFLLR